MRDEIRYFSERESGEAPREADVIGSDAWKGILAKIRARAADGSFGAEYPAICSEGNYVVGTDVASLSDAIRAEIPELSGYDEEDYFGHRQSILDTLVESGSLLPTLDILDLIEFCWKSVGKPKGIGDHSFLCTHTSYSIETPEENNFAMKLKTSSDATGLPTFTEDGRIERLMPLALQSILVDSDFDTGDRELNRLLSTAQRKFLNPRQEIRREALEALWDAWERLKTLDGQGDKKAGAKAMLDVTAGTSSPQFRDALEREAMEITYIGNNLRIRHSETSQEMLTTSDHVDYLLYRLFSLVQLILRSR